MYVPQGWVDVFDDLPQIERKMKNVSINVRILCTDGRELTGYYAYHKKTWYTSASEEIKKPVIAWRTLR